MSQFRLRPPKIRVSENDVEQSCLDVLRLKGWYPIRQHVIKLKMPGGNWVQIGQPGDPDWAIVKPPSFLLEVKRPGKVATEAQKRRHAELRCYGLEVVTVDSAEELLKWLEKRAP